MKLFVQAWAVVVLASSVGAWNWNERNVNGVVVNTPKHIRGLQSSSSSSSSGTNKSQKSTASTSSSQSKSKSRSSSGTNTSRKSAASTSSSQSKSKSSSSSETNKSQKSAASVSSSKSASASSRKSSKSYYSKNSPSPSATIASKASKGVGSKYYYCVVSKQQKATSNPSKSANSLASNDYYTGKSAKAQKSSSGSSSGSGSLKKSTSSLSSSSTNKSQKSSSSSTSKSTLRRRLSSSESASKSAKADYYMTKASSSTSGSNSISSSNSKSSKVGYYEAKASKSSSSSSRSVSKSAKAYYTKASSVSSKSSKVGYYEAKASKSSSSSGSASKSAKTYYTKATSSSRKSSKVEYYEAQHYDCSSYYSSTTDSPLFPLVASTAPPIREQSVEQSTKQEIFVRSPVASTIAAPVSFPTLPPKRDTKNKTTCNNVQLLRQLGSTKYPDGAVRVVSIDETSRPRSVEVSLHQLWSSSTETQQPIDSIFTYYHETPFNKKCYESFDVNPSLESDDNNSFETTTISCSYLTNKAFLEICVVDDASKNVLSLVNGDNADIPKCCAPSFPNDTPTVCYSLEISCEPCEKEETPAPTERPVEETVTTPPITLPIPTERPVNPPTKEPTDTPTISPTEQKCVSKPIVKEVIGNDSVYNIDNLENQPVTVIAGQNDEEVRVKVRQVFDSNQLPMIAVDYRDLESGELQCQMETNVEYGFTMDFNVKCVLGHAEISLYAYVGSDFDEGECEACSIPNENDYVAYQLLISCTPANCEEETPTPNQTVTSTRPTTCETSVPDLCLAIDQSGSVCTNEGLSQKLCDKCQSNECTAGGSLLGTDDSALCCGNYQSITSFAESYVDRLPSESTFSIVKFGSKASVISPTGSTAEEARNAISTSAYTGGYTHTEAALKACQEQLKDSANPVVVLLTDGTPTACDSKDNSGISYKNRGGCYSKTCSKCNGGSFQEAAERAATHLSTEVGASVIPVVISSVATDVEQLEDLARCPATDGGCNVKNYQGLTVDSLEQLGNILDDLVVTTECAGTTSTN